MHTRRKGMVTAAPTSRRRRAAWSKCAENTRHAHPSRAKPTEAMEM